MTYLFALVLLIILTGFLLLWLGQRTQQQTGLPVGEVVYNDTGAWQKVEEPLISRRYGLVGKPDYLVQVTDQGRPSRSRWRSRAAKSRHWFMKTTHCN